MRKSSGMGGSQAVSERLRETAMAVADTILLMRIILPT
jgi:hypothetical protein